MLQKKKERFLFLQQVESEEINLDAFVTENPMNNQYAPTRISTAVIQKQFINWTISKFTTLAACGALTKLSFSACIL